MATLDTITGVMAQRPRLSIEVSPQMLSSIRRVATQASLDADRQVTIKEIVLVALASAHPELQKAVDKELGSESRS